MMEREHQQIAQAQQPRTEFFSLIELYLLHLSHNPKCGLIPSTVFATINSWSNLRIWWLGKIALRSSMDV